MTLTTALFFFGGGAAARGYTKNMWISWHQGAYENCIGPQAMQEQRHWQLIRMVTTQWRGTLHHITSQFDISAALPISKCTVQHTVN